MGHDKSFDILALNVKTIAQEIANQKLEKQKTIALDRPPNFKLDSQACKQSDIESDWCHYWAKQLNINIVYHRKLWELTYILQALYTNDMIVPGKKGIVFGCGQEKLPSYLASKKINILATDLPAENTDASGWINSGQHSREKDSLFFKDICSYDDFMQYVKWRSVDMNDIPSDLRMFDFCWSICALEHLGSVQKGLNFIENSLDVLRPGGVAIHTTEYCFIESTMMPNEGPLVAYSKNHFIELEKNLTKRGFKLAQLNFDIGFQFMDRFIDFPPYSTRAHEHIYELISNVPHLKVFIDGMGVTCFGIIIQKL